MNYRLFYFFTFLLVINLQYSFAQTAKSQHFSIENTIDFLSKDEMEGRLVGSDAEKRSAEFIKTIFESFQLDTIGQSGYYHYLDIDYSLNPHNTSAENRVTIRSQNVVGFLNNHANTTILIGGHYDHIGRNEYQQSMSPNAKNEIHNGADDNASGVAGVLEIARLLSTDTITENANYIFACFSAEEVGLVGSKRLVEYIQTNCALPIDAMINMDMIGRMDTLNELYIGGVGTSSAFPKIIQQNKPEDFILVIDSSGVGPSDHSSLFEKHPRSIFPYWKSFGLSQTIRRLRENQFP